MDKIGLIPEIAVRYRSPYFSHIFAGGYSAGYYAYIWAGVLDSDAFMAFKETSLFETANSHLCSLFCIKAGLAGIGLRNTGQKGYPAIDLFDKELC